jgi:biotin synthase
MIGIGLFIPHKNTPLSNMPIGNINTVLKTLAILRILLPTVLMPATTAIGSLEEDYRPLALNAGANVLMPNFTPHDYKKLYEIYPNKKCTSEDTEEIIASLDTMTKSIGRRLDFSRGDYMGDPMYSP